MFLIDGYNLLHIVSKGRTGPESRDRLIDLIRLYCDGGGYTARIVFDPTEGLRRRDSRGSVEVRCVAPGRTADDEILAALTSTADRTAYTLVTNDRGITREAEKRKVKVIASQEFAKLLLRSAPAPEKGTAPSPGEVDYWLREFGLDDEVV